MAQALAVGCPPAQLARLLMEKWFFACEHVRLAGVKPLTADARSVSYTHLDVYKRQPLLRRRFAIQGPPFVAQHFLTIVLDLADLLDHAGGKDVLYLGETDTHLVVRSMPTAPDHRTPVSYTHLDVYKRQPMIWTRRWQATRRP